MTASVTGRQKDDEHHTTDLVFSLKHIPVNNYLHNA